MPKKIFNSDLETSGQVLASTLTDGTATLSGGVLTANTLTDGTATLSGGVLTANTLTDGTATLSGGVLTANTLTDGTATLSGGVLSGSQVTASILESHQDGHLDIRADGNIISTIDYDEDAIEAEDYPAYWVRLKTGSGQNDYSTLVDINQYYSRVTGYNGGDSLLGPDYAYLRSNKDVGIALDMDNNDTESSFTIYKGDSTPADENAEELFKVDQTGKCTLDGGSVSITHANAYSQYRTNRSGLQFIVDEDNESTDDFFSFSSAGETLLKLTRGTNSTNRSHYIKLPTAPNYYQPKELDILADYESPEDSVTTLASRGRVDIVFGAGYSSAVDASNGGRTVSFRIPLWAEQGNTIVGLDTKAFINSQGNLVIDGAYSPFTGSHIYLSDDPVQVGSTLVLHDNKVELSSTVNSTTVAGICIDCTRVQDIDPEELKNSLQTSELVNGYLVKVAAVGDSRTKLLPGFNVCNENGDIQPGDLLVTSSTPGYLMKQDDDIIRSKTVGKAMEAVTFDANGQATGIYGYIYCG